MSIAQNLWNTLNEIPPSVKLVVVTKTHAIDKLNELYNAGYKIFGENKVQELCDKQYQLTKDIQWHLIGHLQSNKVKFVAPFITLIHSVDSIKLVQEIDKQAQKNARIIDCLLQIYIAQEETKFGLDKEELKSLITSSEFASSKNIRIRGLMGMASNTEDVSKIKSEFNYLKMCFDELKQMPIFDQSFDTLSMGMSSDYKLAIECGSTLIRVGSAIMGSR